MERKKTKEHLVEEGKSSTTMITRQLEPEQQNDCQIAVFGNPLLMDKIVKYSIYKSNGKFQKPAIVAIRLVNKFWLQSASRILKKSGDWTIKLMIGSDSGKLRLHTGIHNNKTENDLDEFISVFSKSSRSIDSFLPISLGIKQLELIKDTSEKIRNLLEQCCDNISSLYVTNPQDLGSMNTNGISLDLPILRTFTFEFYDDVVPREDNISESKANGLRFLQNILLNSKKLQDFTLSSFEEAVVNTSSIILPVTIKSLELKLNCFITQNELTLLTKNQLPNLKTLHLEIGGEQDESLIYKILGRFQHQLTNLYLNVSSNEAEEDESNNLIEFPVMKKLETLTLSGEDLKFVPHLRQAVVPNLTCLDFQDIQESVFLDFVQGSRFENVESLHISLTDIENDFPNTLSPNAQIIEKLISTFPNIYWLTLKINLSETSGLTYLFQNFTTLQKLDLDFDLDDLADVSNGYKIVSLFLGIPLEVATAIVDKTEQNPDVPMDSTVSIMNLKELKSLTLSIDKIDCPGRTKNPLCSDVVLKNGLQKMPRLRDIKLLGGFEIE